MFYKNNPSFFVSYKNEQNICHQDSNCGLLLPVPPVSLPIPIKTKMVLTKPVPIMSDLFTHALVASELALLYAASSSASIFLPIKNPPANATAWENMSALT
eukprot:361980_1